MFKPKTNNMKIKKFICINCGAPKINEIKSPYVVCDYCGSFTDIDYTLGLDFWNADSATTLEYQYKKIEITGRMNNCLQKNERKKYRKIQLEYWDFYYKTFPVYLPPSIDTNEKYGLYLEVAAESSTDYAFDPAVKIKNVELNGLQGKLTYYQSGFSTKVESKSFFNMAEFYIDFLKYSFRQFYNNPEYSIMNELLPESVHLKMKLSSFVQIWLPYLIEEDEKKFLKMTGLSLEYIDIKKPEIEKVNCEHCKKELSVPMGSYKIYCENCRKTTIIKSIFICMSCGAENKVPENPSKPVDCEYCGTENRLIRGLFG